MIDRKSIGTNAKRSANEFIDEIVARLVQAVRPTRIVLFGSLARNLESHDSDVDLLVIESEDFGQGRSRYRELAKLERSLDRIPVPTDILVYSEDEVRRLQTSKNHIVARALREGVELYARP